MTFSTIGIIGGADGPTAVLVSSHFRPGLLIALAAAAALAAILLILRRRR